MSTRTIKLDEKSQRFYQGVAAGSQVRDEHEGVEFPTFQAQRDLYWFYVGAIAAGEHGCTTADDFTGFALGANTRAPQAPRDEDDEDS